MKSWRYDGPERKVVLDDPIIGRTQTIAEVLREYVDDIRTSGPLKINFYVIESPKAYPTDEIGVSDRLAGVLQADILSPLRSGEGRAMRFADKIVARAARGKNVEGLRFGVPTIGVGHQFFDDWRIQVTCPWSVDVMNARVQTSWS